MRAIADGQQAIGKISDRTGLTSSKASFYLSVLRDTGFVVREVPISQLGTDSRRGHYFVTDPYLRFFYRFLSAYQSKLALGQTQQILELIQNELPGFIERNTWQELCRQWLLLASARELVPLPIEEVGSEWAKNYTIDVTGINEEEKNLIIGDCYWRDSPLGLGPVDELAKKTANIVPKKSDGWSVYYVAYSASGWTDEARDQAQQLVADTARRRRWRSAGVRLLDLEEVDTDLLKWSI
jgi:hypothetical protein